MTVSSIDSSILSSLVNQYVDTTEVTTENDAELMMDDFMSIFLTQLQYQDPLNPMENTDMTAQMAQISMVEQQYNTVETLEAISEQLGAQKESQYLGYLGKAVMIDGSAVTIKDGEVIGGNYIIDEDASVDITIYDQDGTKVRTMSAGEIEAGEHKVSWDGLDSEGNLMDDGLFYYEITASDADGDPVDVDTTYSGIINGVSFENDPPYLITDEGTISVDSVIRVYEPD